MRRWNHTVKVLDEVRKAEWLSILGTDEVPVMSPFTQRVNLPIGNREVYMLNLERIDKQYPEGRARLVKFIAAKFGISESEVAGSIDEAGIPILAENCMMMTDANLYAWLLD